MAFQIENGRAVGMTLYQLGREMHGTRQHDRSIQPKYDGVYLLQNDGRTLEVRVYTEQDVLIAQPMGQPAQRLIAKRSHAFAVGDSTHIRVTFEVENGRAVRMTLFQGGRQIEGARKLP
ncbi:MAG: hypothetical protein V4617_07800 [Gemmatimonadota bacterium]